MITPTFGQIYHIFLKISAYGTRVKFFALLLTGRPQYHTSKDILKFLG